MENSKTLEYYIQTIEMFRKKIVHAFDEKDDSKVLESVSDSLSKIAYLVGFIESWFKTQIMKCCDNITASSIIDCFASIEIIRRKMNKLIMSKFCILRNLINPMSNMFKYLSSLVNDFIILCGIQSNIVIFHIDEILMKF